MKNLFKKKCKIAQYCFLLLASFSLLFPVAGYAGKKSKDSEIKPLTQEGLASLDRKSFLFTYSSHQRNDPFRPFLDFSQVERSIPTDSEKPLTPLEKFALNQFHLVGIILAGDSTEGSNSYALVEDPDNIGLTVRVGDMIGNLSGQVKEIKFNEVVIEEPYLDIFDKQQTRTITLRLRDLEEDSYLHLEEDIESNDN